MRKQSFYPIRNRLLLLILLGLTPSTLLYAQWTFSYGPEFGINSSGTPYRTRYIIPERNDIITDTYLPCISPVFGGWSHLGFGKHFFTNLSVQYLWVGYRHHEHRDGNDLLNNTTYQSDHYSNLNFQKISIPMTIGYGFSIKKSSAKIFLGYRKNYLTKGSHYIKNVFEEEDQGNKTVDEWQMNPFDKAQFSTNPERWHSGLLIGFGIDFPNKLGFNWTYTVNESIYYGNNFGWEGYGHWYQDNDIALTLKYSLK